MTINIDYYFNKIISYFANQEYKMKLETFSGYKLLFGKYALRDDYRHYTADRYANSVLLCRNHGEHCDVYDKYRDYQSLYVHFLNELKWT